MSLTLPWRNVTRHKFRTYLIIAAITISVGLETGIAITIDSLYEDFIDRHRGDNFTDITIHPKEKTTIEDIKGISETVESVKGVDKISPVAAFTVSKNSSGLEDVTNKIILYGLTPELHPDYSHLKLESGNRELKSGDVLISQSVAEELNAKVGGKFLLPEIEQFDFQRVNVTIQGIMRDDSTFGNFIGSFFILINFDYLISRFTSNYFVNCHLAVKIVDFITINSLAEEIQDFVGLDYYVYRENSLSETDILAIRSYQTAMNLIILVSFVVEFLFITNVLSMNIRERSKEFGVLKAIGSSNVQVVVFLGLEVLIYGGVAGLIGIPIGIIFSFFPMFFMNFFFNTLRLDTIIIKPTSLFIAYISGILITLLAGLYPIFKAISLPIIQSIHLKTTTLKSKSGYWLFSMIAGAIIIILGFVTANSISSSKFLSFQIISWPFFAIGSIFLGILLLETGLLRFLPKIGEKLMIWHGRVPRIIATRNIGRESQKSTITTMVTALALSFIVILGVTSTGIIESVPDYYEERYGRIDIIAETTDDAQVSLSFADELVMNNSDIERAEFIQQQRTKIESANGYVLGINSTSYKYFFNETMISSLDADIPSLLDATRKGVIISDILLNLIGGRIGENLTIQVSSNSSIEVTITGVTAGNPFLQDGYYLYVSNILFQNYWSNNTANYIIMKLSPDSEPPYVVANQLEGLYPSLNEIIPVDFYARVIENTLTMMTVFFQVLIIYTFLIAALTQFLSILMTNLNMEREIGILRAMGLSHSEVFQTLLVESTLLVTTGVIIGILNGLIGSELLVWYISFSIQIQTNISINFILLWVFLTMVIPIISTEIVSRRSLSKAIAYAINTEIPRAQKFATISWHDSVDWDEIEGFQRNKTLD
ncbi:MAG: ABC transporter permease [Candidatus Hodarchaeales archaeon]|jgi:putative ABC transport system permease protein